MAIVVFVKALGSRGPVRRRNMMVFVFCLTMAVAIVAQVAWPLWPFYALGCLVGSCFLHVFVIEDERDELQRAVIEREQTAKHMAELEKTLERVRMAEKARSMFFSIVSHDIRTPLNAILG
jgi:signal transduction histidine kinase